MVRLPLASCHATRRDGRALKRRLTALKVRMFKSLLKLLVHRLPAGRRNLKVCCSKVRVKICNLLSVVQLRTLLSCTLVMLGGVLYRRPAARRIAGSALSAAEA